MLYGLSMGVNVFSLLATLWLGLYLVTRNLRSPPAILTAFALWAAGGYFLNAFLALQPLAAPAPEVRAWLYRLMVFWPPDVFEMGWKGWLQGWLPAYAVAFWYHATLLMQDGQKRWARRGKAGLGYLLAFAGIVLTARYRSEWLSQAADPLYTSGLRVPLFPLFASVYLIFLLLSLSNLRQMARTAPARLTAAQFRLFLLAAGLVGAAGILEITGWLLKVVFPQVITAVLLAAAALLGGANLARIHAQREARPFTSDFVYSSLGAGAITLVYLAALWALSGILSIPTPVFVGVGILAVITHAMVDMVRMRLDLVQFQSTSAPAAEQAAVTGVNAAIDPESAQRMQASQEVDITPQLVEKALRHLHDYPYLSDLPLAHLRATQQYLDQTDGNYATHIRQGKALAELLVWAMTTLKPDSAKPDSAPPRSWYPYLILHDAYLECIPNQEIIQRLFISEGTFNRTRRAAIGTMAVVLREMEEKEAITEKV